MATAAAAAASGAAAAAAADVVFVPVLERLDRPPAAWCARWDRWPAVEAGPQTGPADCNFRCPLKGPGGRTFALERHPKNSSQKNRGRSVLFFPRKSQHFQAELPGPMALAAAAADFAAAAAAVLLWTAEGRRDRHPRRTKALKMLSLAAVAEAGPQNESG